uniref:Uncharacterized protein n=1 Tax=Panagrolaimus sp. ES5 TaxID=591445 RepID=A0AC34FUX3_9BILA
MSLQGKVALVTGASRGIGRGIALQLGQNGSKVYITGRKPEQSLGTQYTSLPSLEKTAKEIESRGGQAVVVYTDHSDMSQVKSLFQQIESENQGNLDILVNNAFAGGRALTSNGEKLFFEEEPEVWDLINNVGLRNHYYCCVFASRMMVKRQPSQGLIVNISSLGGLRYFMSVPYGVGKQAIDRMSADMGVELAPFKVTVLSLWPGAVKTELTATLIERNELNIKKSKDISEAATAVIMANGESIEFPGKAIVALASDPNVQRYNGRCVLTADLGQSYGFKDIDGRQILSPRSVNYAFANDIVKFPGSHTLANFVPNFFKIPGWLLTVASSRF